jgi:NSS family neurotransmitter:Na+ symporter
MLEPVVSWLVEHRGAKRSVMAVSAGLIAWLLGLGISLSFNLWGHIRPLGMFTFFAEKSIFDVIDFFVANFFLPINAFLIAIFAGWIMPGKATLEELGMTDGLAYAYWRFILRFVAPVAFGVIFYTSVRS